MRKVSVSDSVWDRLDLLSDYLTDEYKLSEHAAILRIDRLLNFLFSLGYPADYALCRFKRWRALGYHCAVFENWVFAYEIFDDGIIIRDMSNAASLFE